MEGYLNDSVPMNFLFGPTRNGKTTLCHFLTGSELSIKRVMRKFFTDVINDQSEDRKIGNSGNSETTKAIFYENFYDFPGFNDTRSPEYKIDTLIHYYKEMQNVSKLRLIIVVEQNFIELSNASSFLNFTNRLIKIFGLQSNCSKGLHFIITKSDGEYANEVVDDIRTNLPGKENFIIEGIKNETIKISSFDNPINIDSVLCFSQENREKILKNINETDFLWRNEIKHNLLRKIFEIIEKMKMSNKYGNIIDLSDVSDEIIRRNQIITSDEFLIIDKDIKINGEILVIDSPIVLVKAIDKKRCIELKGVVCPTIKFSPRVELVINGESLIITASNSEKVRTFLLPGSKDFKQSDNFICLESICINGGWTEYASHNNKFIDLIVYYNRNFGKIDVKEEWKIKKITCDISIKLHINECMKSKKSIIEESNSLRSSQDAKSYLKKKFNTELDQEMVDFIESYIVNLPSIFQIFMKPSYFKRISSSKSEYKGLNKIRIQFIRRYMRLISDFNSQKKDLNIKKSDLNQRAYNDFLIFLNEGCKFTGNVSAENYLVEKINDFMKTDEFEYFFDNFISFYNVLAQSEEKIELYNYKITGDISMYYNFEAFIYSVTSGLAIYNNEAIILLSSGPAISVTALGLALGAGAGNLIITRVFTQALTSSIIGITTASAAAVGVIFLGVDIGINAICAYAKSGYYENEIVIDVKEIRLDCKWNNL
ncbi:hypothetical protein SteCoe_33460 [Stentor coeruleus]|uniref:Uncharacterized protein n=1 Tax=Stentor coeruleus TaxID=5963 RepID=A0A1R2AWM8_9CILI|nr:hypothetical protein SteCoe_33460 [Stentor coeruleus]